MKSRRWARIEPGFYQLRGTGITITDMRGQSVKWTGLILKPWVVRDNHGGEITSAETYAKAKQAAEQHAATSRP